MTAIKIEKLQFAYTKKTILNIDSLTITEKEKVFLYGPSGSGKSTLLNLIQGVLKVRIGLLEVLGTNLNSLSGSQRDHFRGKNMGCIFQSFNLINFLTVKENILLPFEWDKTQRKISRKISVEELASKLGLCDILHQRADAISVGQAQRVAIARAIISNPPLIIADEPTSALDQDQKDEFIKLLLENVIDQTILFVSHDQSLKSFFDRTISLKEINQ